MVITSRKNTAIQFYKKLLTNKRFRKEENLFCLEGFRLVNEMLLSKGEAKMILASETFLAKNSAFIASNHLNQTDVLVISDALAEYISDVPTPQGVFAIAKRLDKKCMLGTIKTTGRYLVLCQLQDPGNLGTILRSADAFGMDGVFLFNCCDIYSPKVVRSAMGALFHLPFALCDDIHSFLTCCKSRHIITYAAVVCNGIPITDSAMQRGGALLIGNEGNGLDEETASLCTERITIPMRSSAESLNASVAASVCMWEMFKDE